MVPNEMFQKMLYDLFCLWHGVQRHYDPPITDGYEQRMSKVKTMICKLLTEIDGRVNRVKTHSGEKEQDFYEEWTMLTWNVLCITSRLQEDRQTIVVSQEDKVIFARLNQALVDLVNYSRDYLPPPGDPHDEGFAQLRGKMDDAMAHLHGMYRQINEFFHTPESMDTFAMQLEAFAEQRLNPTIETFKVYCNTNCVVLWRAVRAAQIQRMRDLRPLPDQPMQALVRFYSHMMYTLAVLGARLQGFRYSLQQNKVFGNMDPVRPLSESVFAALELLMSDCVLATEPSTSAILVTNNLFSMNCGALARGVVFKDFEIQVVSEENAEHIQSEMRRVRLLQQPAPIGMAPSAALLAMKPASGTKRTNAASNAERQYADSPNTTAHKKSDVNSKESVTIYPVYNAKNRYWAATYPHLLCTTRQKGRHSTNNSYQDLSPNGQLDKSSGKRPIFYFHIKATMFSPSGRFATAHTLSLPFTIATRRNQDCQVQRMMSSYTATIFWLYGSNAQDGLLLQWADQGMHWEHFMHLFKQHFSVNAAVNRGLIDSDFDLLQYKLQCPDCKTNELARVNGAQKIVTFKNVLCPHLRFECGNTNVKFSVWRGMLELLQIFHDTRNNVRRLWEQNFLLGFLEFDQVDKLLETHHSALIMRLSFVTGGTICFTLKTRVHSLDHGLPSKPIHLEPLDLKKLQTKCLKDYLRDIADAEKVKYILNGNLELVPIRDVLEALGDAVSRNPDSESRDISSNVTHSGDIDAMQHIRFTAMRIAVVTCKVKPPSADGRSVEIDERLGGRLSALMSPHDDFIRELVQLANFHGRSRADMIQALEGVPDYYFTHADARADFHPPAPPAVAPFINGGYYCATTPSSGGGTVPPSPHTPHPIHHTPLHSPVPGQPQSVEYGKFDYANGNIN